MNENCTFCKIINGFKKAHVVYQDDSTIAFFPRVMYTKGHLIIVPIDHYVDILQIREDILASMMEMIKFLSLHCKEVLGAEGINLLHASGESAQQSIPHFHIHLLPRFNNDMLDAWPNMPAWDGDSEELYNKLKVIDTPA